jgi:Right handed beta helix region
VHDIDFVGLNFAHSNWFCDFNKGEMCDGQSANFQRTAGVTVDGALRIGFQACSFTQSGHYSLWIRHAAHDIAIESCEVTDSGTGGVRIGGAGMFPSEFERVNRISLNNSKISSGGWVYPSGCGILVEQASNVGVTHNAIHNFAYTGVSVGWDWSYSPTQAHQNDIAFNEVGSQILKKQYFPLDPNPPSSCFVVSDL